jgi:uncharacterized membrane protein SpoIIM required for sporulation
LKSSAPYRAEEQCICPLELQAGIIEGYWTPMAARLARI